MNKLSLLCFLLLSSLCLSQPLEDVIYKKDQSILRGQLIEQNFALGRYKIQLMGGSILVVHQDEILSIKKEAPLPSQDYTSFHYGDSKPALTSSNKDAIDHVWIIGNLWHSLYSPSTNSTGELRDAQRYYGFKLVYQKNHNDLFASRHSWEYGKLKKIETINQEDEALAESSDVPNSRYMGLSSTLIISSNLNKGWQFYTGVGVFEHSYLQEEGDDFYIGARLELGMNYAWQRSQLGIQYHGSMSDNYGSGVDSIFSGGIQYGYAF